ncbi:hypothetical protein CHGG_10509 [Chaetomium globosum CBS 148.51]|uniref:Uncharacterized protein n=1 Tax=Chaetomium globosum (strain ATCC 6205 / CBS 148.51 / DSM 1962 / NBRC 6347 / NRRL 1970) TaxID=306901 RepID=Q2GNE5_CHAGB|nr:uncharacterized protein CHGG_10509 [Chaetomium globosum CBS 148.51]EAQ84105.1 hypothetical protein CHGG_10509 [Chaetomium globosum CBS 148.51]
MGGWAGSTGDLTQSPRAVRAKAAGFWKWDPR